MYYYIAKYEDGDVRLYGSRYSTIGIVILCVNSTWGTVCGDKWDNNDAGVVCTYQDTFATVKFISLVVFSLVLYILIKGAIPLPADSYSNS